MTGRSLQEDAPLLCALPDAAGGTAAPTGGADLLFVNPPSPGGDTWIRCQHRAGQRAPDGTTWPQTALAQLAALFPERPVALLDCMAGRLSQADLTEELQRRRPRWYVTQLAGPTLQADLRCVAMAHRQGARTVAFGPVASPVARELLWRFPALDYILVGEPELTLRELVDTVDGRHGNEPASLQPLLRQDAGRMPHGTLGAIRGLAWRHEGEVLVNPPRPLLARLDALPLPAHHLLPLTAYGAPEVRAPSGMVVTGRGCPADCSFCLKHVLHGGEVRLRAPERLVEEMDLLRKLGARHVYLHADQFGVCRAQVADLCRELLAASLRLSWSCTMRAEAADEEMLHLMAQAGCRHITWALVSASESLLWRCGRGGNLEWAGPAVQWARRSGIRNRLSFLIGLPGETEETIRQTTALAQKLNAEQVTFELAVPRPGTPLWEQAQSQGWLRPGIRWEEGDPAGPALLDYPRLPAAQLELWLERAYRDWALRPGSTWGNLRLLAMNRAGVQSPVRWLGT